jgi:hypothetical protein
MWILTLIVIVAISSFLAGYVVGHRFGMVHTIDLLGKPRLEE